MYNSSDDDSQTFEEFSEISNETTTFFKWSDDEQTYTELGSPGIIEVDDGFLIFFLSETPSMDNTQVGSPFNSPRNVGFVKVSKDL